MSNLPPYSTYRTDAKQMMFPQATSHGNILTFTPPGFKQELNVKFPDSRLAVCEKCKKNFKTRDMCRVRSTHTTAPWTTAYICITIDDSCTDENGMYVDKPLTVRMVQWQPFCVRTPFGSKTPVCAACKRTNRTRSFCRERHKHRQLPWCTVYVLLSALDATDPSTVVAGASKKVEDDGSGEVKATGSETSGDEPKLKPDDTTLERPETPGGDADDVGDDINEIPESRTFLAKVSSASTTVHWLELSDFDASEAAPFPGNVAAETHYNAMAAQQAQPLEHAPPPPYYAHTYQTVQQHHDALKSRTQYFFAMQTQQQQQGQPLPYHTGQPQPQQPPPWQTHPPPYAGHAMVPGGQPGETHQPGATAGEAAAAQQRRGAGVVADANDQQQQPQQPQTSPSQQQQPPQQPTPPPQQEQQPPPPPLPPPHHWPMYYPAPHYAMPPHDGVLPHPGMQSMPPPDEQEQFLSPPKPNVEAEEPEAKRQRVD